MTRDRDVERYLVEWLSEGPSTAPPDVVDRALERVATRPRRHPWWAWLRSLPTLPWWRAGVVPPPRRLALLVAAFVLIVSATVVVVAPLADSPAALPVLDASVVYDVAGTATLVHEGFVDTHVERTLRLEGPDPRTSGDARQILNVEDGSDGLQRSTGVMRLENEWGSWEGVVYGTRFSDGSELQYGWLSGRGAYEGSTYFHSTRLHDAGTEATVEGAIWPGEPPSMPDPSMLP